MCVYIYVYICGGPAHVFIPNHPSTDLSVRCMRPYDEYRQSPPIQKGAPAVMQHCLITVSTSRRTTDAMS